MTQNKNAEGSLLSEVEEFLLREDVKASRLGRDVMRDPRFVRELRRGRVVRPSTESKVRGYIEKYKSS